MAIIRFQGDYELQKQWFNFGQEYEFIDKYRGLYNDPCDDCPPVYKMFYRFQPVAEGTIYSAMEDMVVEIQHNTSNNQNEITTAATWNEKVTKDQITAIYEVEDYVRAAKEFQNVDIAAKKKQEQTDYQAIWPLSVAIKRNETDR